MQDSKHVRQSLSKSLSKNIMAGFDFRRASSSASVSKARTERLVNEIQRMREKKEVERDFNEDQKTRGELRELERKIFARQRMLAMIAICSLVLGCMINEMCAGNDYDESPLLEEEQAFLDDPNRPARECKTTLVTALKFAQSALTVCLLVMIVARFRLRVLQVSVKQRLEDREVATLKHRKDYKTSETPGTAIIMLVLELVLCAVHTVPGIQPLELRMEALGRKLYYRSESLLCGFMFVRLYHVYFWQEQRVYLRYFDLEASYLLQDYKTIKRTQESASSHRTLAFKVAMTRNPGVIIMIITSLLLGSATYIVRLAEGPAGMPHSRYIWNQMWVTFTQATTGYGESVPVTHIGRGACVIVMVSMPIIIAFITASTTKSLNLTPDEGQLMMGIDANRLRLRLLSVAATLIQRWWRGLGDKGGGHGPREGLGAIGEAHVQRLALTRDLFRAGQELKRFYLHNKGWSGNERQGLLSLIGLAPAVAAGKHLASPRSRVLPSSSVSEAGGENVSRASDARQEQGAEKGFDFGLPKRSAELKGGSVDMDEVLVELQQMQVSHSNLETLVLQVVSDVSQLVRQMSDRREGRAQERWCDDSDDVESGEPPRGSIRRSAHRRASAHGKTETAPQQTPDLSPSVSKVLKRAFTNDESDGWVEADQVEPDGDDSRRNERETIKSLQHASSFSSSMSSDSICPPTIGLLSALSPKPQAGLWSKSSPSHQAEPAEGGGRRSGRSTNRSSAASLEEELDNAEDPSEAMPNLTRLSHIADGRRHHLQAGKRSVESGGGAKGREATVAAARAAANGRKSESGRATVEERAREMQARLAAAVQAGNVKGGMSLLEERLSSLEEQFSPRVARGARAPEAAVAPASLLRDASGQGSSLQEEVLAGRAQQRRHTSSHDSNDHASGDPGHQMVSVQGDNGRGHSSIYQRPSNRQELGLGLADAESLEKRVQSFKASVENSIKGAGREAGNRFSTPVGPTDAGEDETGRESPVVVTPRGTTRINRHHVFPQTTDEPSIIDAPLKVHPLSVASDSREGASCLSEVGWAQGEGQEAGGVRRTGGHEPSPHVSNGASSSQKARGSTARIRAGQETQGKDGMPSSQMKHMEKETHAFPETVASRASLEELPGGRDVWETSIDRVVGDLREKRSPRLDFTEKRSPRIVGAHGSLSERGSSKSHTSREASFLSPVIEEQALIISDVSAVTSPRTVGASPGSFSSTPRNAVRSALGVNMSADVVSVSRTPGLSRRQARLL